MLGPASSPSLEVFTLNNNSTRYGQYFAGGDKVRVFEDFAHQTKGSKVWRTGADGDFDSVYVASKEEGMQRYMPRGQARFLSPLLLSFYANWQASGQACYQAQCKQAIKSQLSQQSAWNQVIEGDRYATPKLQREFDKVQEKVKNSFKELLFALDSEKNFPGSGLKAFKVDALNLNQEQQAFLSAKNLTEALLFKIHDGILVFYQQKEIQDPGGQGSFNVVTLLIISPDGLMIEVQDNSLEALQTPFKEEIEKIIGHEAFAKHVSDREVQLEG